MRTSPLLLLLITAVACGSSGAEPPAEEGAPAPGPVATPTPGAPALPGGATPPREQAPPSTFACAPARAGKAGDQTLKLKVGDKERTALLHVPASYDATKGNTLVLAFHGYGVGGAQMRTQTGLDAAADKRGFIVVYAEGTGVASKGFNGGDCCGAAAWSDAADDLAFGRALVKTIEKDYCVDPKRVHNAGFSNGGFMSYRFACEAADVFASVASVSGVLGTEPAECKPSRPVPMLHIHGTADRTVPFEGGPGAGGLGLIAGVTFRSVAESVSTLRKKYACAEASTEIFKKGDTRCEAWTGGRDGARVELCTVTEGGHQWPGGQPNALSGKTSTDLAATASVVDFFLAHPMK